MPDATAWTPRPISVCVPPGERRTPIAMVRLSMGDGGVPAVEAHAATWGTIQQAAIGAIMLDQAAREHLLGPELRKLGKAAAKVRVAL